MRLSNRPGTHLVRMIGLLLFLGLAGCATPPKELTKDFWQQTNQRVAVVLHKLPPQGGFFQEGSQGLLDVAITSSATHDMQEHLKTLDAGSFAQVQQKFVDSLRARGFDAVAHPTLIDAEQLEERSASEGEFTHDLSAVFAEHNADQILLLRLFMFGAARAYYSFIPISDPSGTAAVFGAMISRDKHRISWSTGDSILNAFVKEPVIGEWDQPPSFPNLTKATRRALDRSQKVLHDKFFTQ